MHDDRENALSCACFAATFASLFALKPYVLHLIFYLVLNKLENYEKHVKIRCHYIYANYIFTLRAMMIESMRINNTCKGPYDRNEWCFLVQKTPRN